MGKAASAAGSKPSYIRHLKLNCQEFLNSEKTSASTKFIYYALKLKLGDVYDV
ncbi:hypothetical protein KIN20_005206 [Parelaphostrongylus tenuis]|uniref:Uncharacterized protein n=1 Tax=Parelaphostrongylus tenuis TaxID=148309 RepID=A0AAD5MIJ0_PARTN|nr:hypothetical protein KIN20_005206 [Parelaphostrongylus tenuis]